MNSVALAASDEPQAFDGPPYEDLWDRHIKPYFGDARLASYGNSDATAFLTSLP